MGGEISIIVSGGAALQPRLGRLFTCAGINILEGYGLTETAPVIAVSDFSEHGIKFGTVGPVIAGTSVNIAGDGEICVKGPGVMKGYYKEPEMTKEAVDEEGWFHTGDLGHIEPEGQLKTGRKKNCSKPHSENTSAPSQLKINSRKSFFIEELLGRGTPKFAVALSSSFRFS